MVLVYPAAVKDNFKRPGLRIVAHSVEHTGFDGGQLHKVLLL